MDSILTVAAIPARQRIPDRSNRLPICTTFINPTAPPSAWDDAKTHSVAIKKLAIQYMHSKFYLITSSSPPLAGLPGRYLLQLSCISLTSQPVCLIL